MLKCTDGCLSPGLRFVVGVKSLFFSGLFNKQSKKLGIVCQEPATRHPVQVPGECLHLEVASGVGLVFRAVS